MIDDELRNRLVATNPIPPSQPVDPVTSDRARAQMEEIMSTATAPPATRPRAYRLIGTVAAVLAVTIGAATLLGGTSSEPLVLTADGSDAMAMCLPFEVDTLAEMSPAFGGTVVELTDSVVTLEVDRWYSGAGAGVVEIRYTPGAEALIGTPTFGVGQRYLITATEGAVNGCGYSGVATGDYEAAFDQAFGA